MFCIRKISFLFIFVITIFSPFLKTFAATYYVDATGGNNSNNGTSTVTAWQTIAKVTSSTFTAGDQILFKRGQTFQGNLQFANETGASGSRIIVGAYGTGTNPTLESLTGRTIDLRANASYFTFENLNLRSAASDNIFTLTGTYTGLIFQNLDIASSSAINFTGTTTGMLISNVNIHDTTSGIIMYVSINDTFQNISINGGSGFRFGSSGTASSTGAVVDGLTLTNNTGNAFAFNKIENSTISNITVSSSSLSGMVASFGMKNVSFNNLNLFNNTQYGMNLFVTESASITNATSTGNKLNNVYLSGIGSITVNNLYSAYSETGNGLNWGASAPTSKILVTNSIFEYNGTVSTSSSNGVLFSSSGEGNGFATTTNSIARYNRNDGFNIRGSVNAVFDQTISDSNGVDGIGSDGDGYSWHSSSTGSLSRSLAINNKKGGVVNVNNTYVEVFNNIFVKNVSSSLPMIFLTASTSARIFNNTFYDSTGEGTAISIAECATSTAVNNIIQGFNIGLETGTEAQLTEHNNIVFNTGTPFKGITQAITSTTSDPDLINPTNNQFGINAGSIARKTGTNILCPINDYAGTTRTDTCDIGAFIGADLSIQVVSTSTIIGAEGTIINPKILVSGGIIGQSRKIPLTTSGTATFGADYIPVPEGQFITIPAGDYTTPQNIDLSFLLQNDTINEQQDELGKVTLYSVVPGIIINASNTIDISIASVFSRFDTTTFTGISQGGGSVFTAPVPTPVVVATTTTLGCPQGFVCTQTQFTRDLKLNMQGEDVLKLQQLLNKLGFTVAKSGAGSAGKETKLFGPATRAAVIRFQKFYKIVPSAGYFGPISKAKIVEVVK